MSTLNGLNEAVELYFGTRLRHNNVGMNVPKDLDFFVT